MGTTLDRVPEVIIVAMFLPRSFTAGAFVTGQTYETHSPTSSRPSATVLRLL